MNPKPISETDAIRSDIDMTRRRMDDTINALGERLQGRHLLDEVIGFFRSNDADADTAADRVKEKMSAAGTQIREKVSAAAGSASRAVGDASRAVGQTIKENPLPVILLGAGAAWLTYSIMSQRRREQELDLNEHEAYDPDAHLDRPLEYPGPESSIDPDCSSEESGFGQFKDTVADKAASAAEQLKDKVSGLTDQASQKFDSLKQRAGEVTNRAKERTRELYQQSRERVVRTANDRPLEVGLGCLAVGVLLGLALPTPGPVHRVAGPAVDRLRSRTRQSSRDILQKGKRVARAAADAARQEAQAQGLTLDKLRRSGRAVADRAQSAAQDAARGEGMMAGDADASREGTASSDPSAAGPTV
jgi:ElaB/YqjD/DUF883 family membrane-anchored ribosome-binding protein